MSSSLVTFLALELGWSTRLLSRCCLSSICSGPLPVLLLHLSLLCLLLLLVLLLFFLLLPLLLLLKPAPSISVSVSSAWVLPHPTTVTTQSAVASATAEENEADGSMYTTSTDLELMHDTLEQVVGIRFTNIQIPGPTDSADWVPQTIDSAVLSFTIDEVNDLSSRPLQIAIYAEAIDNSAEITESVATGADWSTRQHATLVPYELSRRASTNTAVLWAPSTDTASLAVDAVFRTPDLSPLVQEIISRPGWRSGNAIMFILAHVDGTGVRWVESGSTADTIAGLAGAPTLNVTWGEEAYSAFHNYISEKFYDLQFFCCAAERPHCLLQGHRLLRSTPRQLEILPIVLVHGASTSKGLGTPPGTCPASTAGARTLWSPNMCPLCHHIRCFSNQVHRHVRD